MGIRVLVLRAVTAMVCGGRGGRGRGRRGYGTSARRTHFTTFGLGIDIFPFPASNRLRVAVQASLNPLDCVTFPSSYLP